MKIKPDCLSIYLSFLLVILSVLFSKFTPFGWVGTFEVFAQDSSVGDLNGDGKINSIDIVLLFSNFNASRSASDPGNLGKVTSEALLLLTNWGKTKDDGAVSMDGEGVFLPPPPGTTDEEIAAGKLDQIEFTEKNYEDYIRSYNQWLSSDDFLARQTLSSPVPGYYETSEFMFGSVAVGVILPESVCTEDSGNNCEDWTVDEVNRVKSEIIDATNWWIARESGTQLSFVYEWYTIYDTPGDVVTSVEPIAHHHHDQGLWIHETLGRLGYTGSSYFTKVRHFNNDLRNRHGTDWAFTIFVVDSSRDGDNKFFNDDYFAYAYLGGPFLVMTYGNDGYGPGNMDAVTAHEMGHIFRALDQYWKANLRCTYRSGYLHVENQNSVYPCTGCCDSNVSSIMRGLVGPYGSGAVDDYARGQLGWWDQDSNNILDPIDTDLEVIFNPPVEGGGGEIIYSGSVEEIPYSSPSRPDNTINKITSVQYSIDDTWINTTPNDGSFDSYREEFTFMVDPGVTITEVKVIDNFGVQKLTLPPGIYVNSASGQSCDQICNSYSQVCADVGLNNLATDNDRFEYSIDHCTIRRGTTACPTVMVDKQQICGGKNADWTNCKCVVPPPTPTPTPTPTIAPGPGYPGCSTGELLVNPELNGTTGWQFYPGENTTGWHSDGHLIMQTSGSGGAGWAQAIHTNLKNKRVKLSGSLAKNVSVSNNPYFSITAHRGEEHQWNYGGILFSTSSVGVFEDVSKEIDIGSDIDWIEVNFNIWNAPASTSYADWISLCVENMIINPSFENGTANWAFWSEGTQNYAGEVVSPGYQDDYSYKITTGEDQPSGWGRAACVNQGFFVSNPSFEDPANFAGKTLKLSGYIKTSASSTTAGLKVNITTPSGRNSYWLPGVIPAVSSLDWQYVEKVMDIPADATKIETDGCSSGAVGGQAWFDDVKLIEVNP